MQVLIGTSGDDPEVRSSPNREDFRLLDEFSRIGIGIGRCGDFEFGTVDWPGGNLLERKGRGKRSKKRV